MLPVGQAQAQHDTAFKTNGSRKPNGFAGASDGIRTHDLLFTKQWEYRGEAFLLANG